VTVEPVRRSGTTVLCNVSLADSVGSSGSGSSISLRFPSRGWFVQRGSPTVLAIRFATYGHPDDGQECDFDVPVTARPGRLNGRGVVVADGTGAHAAATMAITTVNTYLLIAIGRSLRR